MILTITIMVFFPKFFKKFHYWGCLALNDIKWQLPYVGCNIFTKFVTISGNLGNV